jgi:hypothetical protein
LEQSCKDVDARDKPGHDGLRSPYVSLELNITYSTRAAKYLRAGPVAAAPAAT